MLVTTVRAALDAAADVLIVPGASAGAWPGAFTDTVEVTAAATILDLRSASVGLTVDDELISRVPVGRRLADTFYLAPGASSSSGAGTTT